MERHSDLEKQFIEEIAKLQHEFYKEDLTIKLSSTEPGLTEFFRERAHKVLALIKKHIED